MVSNILCSIDAFIDFDKIWWTICSGLMNIISLLEQAFTFVVGGEGVYSGDEIASLSSNLLTETFTALFGENGSLRNVYLSMVFLCMILMIIFVIIGVIRAQFSQDAPATMGKMIGKAFWSILKMLFVPVFFFAALVVVGFIFDQLLMIMQNNGESGTSLAETLCRCFTNNTSIHFNSSYEGTNGIKSLLQQGAFDYVLCILTSCCLLVTLVTSILAVTKRFVKVFFYYVSAPMTLAKSMLDEGKSWELWKDNLLAQLLGAGGVIISMYIFVQVVPIITNIIDKTTTISVPVAAILKIVFILGMSTVPASSTALMAQLVSQGAGQNESNDLMHTQQMLGNGLKLAGAVAGKALAGGLSALAGSGSSSAIKSMLGGGTSGVGSTAKTLASGGGTSKPTLSGPSSAQMGSSVAVGGMMAAARTGSTAQSGARSAVGGASSHASPSSNSGSHEGRGAFTGNTVPTGTGNPMANSGTTEPVGGTVASERTAPTAPSGSQANPSFNDGSHEGRGAFTGNTVPTGTDNPMANSGNTEPVVVQGTDTPIMSAEGTAGNEVSSSGGAFTGNVVDASNSRRVATTENTTDGNQLLYATQGGDAPVSLASDEQSVSGTSGGLWAALKRTETVSRIMANSEAHRGGLQFAIMRGGVLGAAAYGATRLVSQAGTITKTAAKKLWRNVKKIPVAGTGNTVGEYTAKPGAAVARGIEKNSTRRAVKRDSRANKREENATTLGRTRMERKLHNMETRANGTQGIENSVPQGVKKLYDRKLEELNARAKKVNKTLSSDRFNHATDSTKEAYRKAQLGTLSYRTQNALNATNYGRGQMNRFLAAMQGRLHEQPQPTSETQTNESGEVA